MDIRYVCSETEHRTDAVLAALAERAKACGIKLAGTVQPVDPDSPPEKCNIILGLLLDGERRKISFDLQPGVTGCRLNTDALETAVMVVHQRLPAAHALVVNKFGKQEAVGRGLVAAIGEACDRGIPILVGVSPDWLAAFLEFAADRAHPLPADEDAVFEWLRAACSDRAA